MFEIGREYTFTTGIGADESEWGGEIQEIDLPLLRVKTYNEDIVFNTASPTFVKAILHPSRTREEKEAGRKKWEKLLADVKSPKT